MLKNYPLTLEKSQSYSIYYHEGHEDHEEFFNLTSLRVFRALRGDISSS